VGLGLGGIHKQQQQKCCGRGVGNACGWLLSPGSVLASQQLAAVTVHVLLCCRCVPIHSGTTS
jgi:hypothetical protein